eukprot:gene7863-9680_t
MNEVSSLSSNLLDRTSSTIYVSNIRHSTPINSIFNIFSKFGPLERCEIPENKFGKTRGFAFIEFENKLHAYNAFEELSKQEILLDGRILKLEWARATKLYKEDIQNLSTESKEKIMGSFSRNHNFDSRYSKKRKGPKRPNSLNPTSAYTINTPNGPSSINNNNNNNNNNLSNPNTSPNSNLNPPHHHLNGASPNGYDSKLAAKKKTFIKKDMENSSLTTTLNNLINNPIIPTTGNNNTNSNTATTMNSLSNSTNNLNTSTNSTNNTNTNKKNVNVNVNGNVNGISKLNSQSQPLNHVIGSTSSSSSNNPLLPNPPSTILQKNGNPNNTNNTNTNTNNNVINNNSGSGSLNKSTNHQFVGGDIIQPNPSTSPSLQLSNDTTLLSNSNFNNYFSIPNLSQQLDFNLNFNLSNFDLRGSVDNGQQQNISQLQHTNNNNNNNNNTNNNTNNTNNKLNFSSNQLPNSFINEEYISELNGLHSIQQQYGNNGFNTSTFPTTNNYFANSQDPVFVANPPGINSFSHFGNNYSTIPFNNFNSYFNSNFN